MMRRSPLLLPMILLAGCSPKPSASTAPTELPPVPITVAPVESRAYQRRALGTGTLNGIEEVQLALKVHGPIKRIPCNSGAFGFQRQLHNRGPVGRPRAGDAPVVGARFDRRDRNRHRREFRRGRARARLRRTAGQQDHRQ